MFKRLKQLALVAGVLLGTAMPCAHAQQDYPNRPVKIIVGYVAGGGPDFTARTFGQKISEILGQPVVIENRPGAGATTATAQVARAPADGYTLLLGETGQLFVAPFVHKNLAYDTVRDFTPISLLSAGPLIVVSNSKLPIKSVSDLLREAKANPGKLDVGTSGVGTIHHIALAVLMADAGIDMTHVPYKGSGQSVASALAGDVPLLITSMTAAGAHVAAGKLNVLAVTSAKRLPSYAEIPSLSETLKDFDYSSEMGLLAPAGLPPLVQQKLFRAVRQAMESTEVQEAFKKTSTMLVGLSPEEYAQNIGRNLKKYERAVRLAKIPVAE